MKLKQVAIAVDQLGNTLIGGMADETISARAFRNNWTKTIRIIDWLFQDPNHCRNSYYSELIRTQLPKAYRKEAVCPKCMSVDIASQ